MTVIKLSQTSEAVYIVLGIDEHEHDQVLGVFNSYYDATNECCHVMMKNSDYYDLWIEKHNVM